jgi:hypothetical protein
MDFSDKPDKMEQQAEMIMNQMERDALTKFEQLITAMRSSDETRSKALTNAEIGLFVYTGTRTGEVEDNSFSCRCRDSDGADPSTWEDALTSSAKSTLIAIGTTIANDRTALPLGVVCIFARTAAEPIGAIEAGERYIVMEFEGGTSYARMAVKSDGQVFSVEPVDVTELAHEFWHAMAVAFEGEDRAGDDMTPEQITAQLHGLAKAECHKICRLISNDAETRQQIMQAPMLVLIYQTGRTIDSNAVKMKTASGATVGIDDIREVMKTAGTAWNQDNHVFTPVATVIARREVATETMGPIQDGEEFISIESSIYAGYIILAVSTRGEQFRLDGIRGPLFGTVFFDAWIEAECEREKQQEQAGLN